MAKWVRRLCLQNFVLKLISLLLAIGLWLVVAHDPIAEVEVRVPIEFNLLPDNIVIDSGTFTQAVILLRGPQRLIHRLQPGDVHADVDLGNVQPGERAFDLTARHVHVPRDMEVVQIIPGQFHLSFDIRDTRTVEVQPRLTGTFASGMHVARVIADPPNITISGPRHRLEEVKAVNTDPVDASGTIGSASFLTQANIADALIQVVHPRPIRVTVIMEGAGEEKKAK